MSDVPYDITEQILLRIPARSLLRLSLVCKQWRSLISGPKFVKDHTNHVVLDQSSRHHRWIFDHCTSEKDDDSWRYYSVILQSIDCESLNSTNHDFDFKFKTQIGLIDSCNGLLLVGGRVLLNPLFSKKLKFLPPFIDTDPLDRTNLYRSVLHGLGYASSIDDYKAVRVHINFRPDDNRYYTNFSVHIYSLKTNTWKINICKRSESIFGIHIHNVTFLYSVTGGTHIQDSIYWIARNEGQHEVIIVFDLISEKFKWMKIPWGDDNLHHHWLVGIVQVRGHLGASLSNVNSDEIGIWIWNEGENEEGYWSKFFTIPIKNPLLTRVLSFMDSNDVLLGEKSKKASPEKLIMYDAASMTFRDIPCRDVDWPVCHTVETLALPVSSDGDTNPGFSI